MRKARAHKLAAGAMAGLMLGAASLFAAGAFAPEASADQPAPKVSVCQESIPKGAKRPKIREKFAGEAIAGFGVPLEIEIRHGKGEKPLPNGFKIIPSTPMGKLLEESGFILAEPDGGSGVVVETREEQNVSITRVTIPLVVAPIKSGDQSLTLPQLPLQIDRANGEQMVVCTQLHLITAHDPTASEEDPKPRANPDARHQREDWPLIKWLLAGLIALLVLGIIVAWWVRRQMRKPVPQPIPIRRLPWEEALSELEAIATGPLIETKEPTKEQRAELFDRVSDTVRKYLGARYGFEGLGFDGLETTTDEMMHLLRRVRPTVPNIALVETFLTECDLVKFARVVPEQSDGKLALQRADTIVRSTIPVAPPPGPAAGPSAGPGQPLGPPLATPPPPPAFTVLPTKISPTNEERRP